MPQAIAAAIVSALAVTGTTAVIVSAVVQLAVAVGLNFIASSIFGRGGTPKPSDGQQTRRVAVGSRVRHYGKVRVAGQTTFYESRGGRLFILVTTGHGRINAVSELLINGEVQTVDGSGVVTSISYTKKGVTRRPVSAFWKLGTDSQTAYTQLSSVFTEWTSNHRQRGCSSVLLIADSVPADRFSEVYGSREPEAAVTIETSLVYDPRKDSTAGGSGSHRANDPATWEYSDNWALCFADYLAHPDGYGLGMDMINWANVADEADICDELVTTVDARSIKRWRVAGSYRLAEDERRSVVKEFLKAANGFLWQDADGLANIRCGRWIAPTVHIPEKHIISCSATLGADPQDRANEVRVIYMEPALDYTETEAAPLVDEAAYLALGRREVSRFDCYFCPDHNQAQRLGKPILARLGERWSLTITANLYGLNVIGERFITVTVSELGITELAFEVSSLSIDLQSLNVQLGLIQVEEADFTFDAETEEGTPPAAAPGTGATVTLDTMTGIVAAVIPISIGGGATGAALQVTWDEPSRLDLLAQIQYRETGATEWLEMVVSQEADVATSGVISAGVSYDVRGRFFTVTGRVGEWTTEIAAASPADSEIIYDGGGA